MPEKPIVDARRAREIAEALLVAEPGREEASIVVEDHRDVFVAFFTSPVPLPPGGSRIAIPKDGRPARYLSSGRLDRALFHAGLGAEPPVGSATPDW